jgi:uncharacterized membrane protein
MKLGEIKRSARESLKGKWGKMALFTIIQIAMLACTSVLSIFVWPVFIGYMQVALSVANKKSAETDDLFSSFKAYGGSLWLVFYEGLLVVLWSILIWVVAILLMLAIHFARSIIVIAAVIANIIVCYRYALSYFIFAENKEMLAGDAIKKSIELMKGNKLKYFWLNLSFIGWEILSPFTLCIGCLFLLPYMRVSYAVFYNDIKKQKSKGDNIDENGSDSEAGKLEANLSDFTKSEGGDSEIEPKATSESKSEAPKSLDDDGDADVDSVSSDGDDVDSADEDLTDDGDDI